MSDIEQFLKAMKNMERSMQRVDWNPINEAIEYASKSTLRTAFELTASSTNEISDMISAFRFSIVEAFRPENLPIYQIAGHIKEIAASIAVGYNYEIENLHKAMASLIEAIADLMADVPEDEIKPAPTSVEITHADRTKMEVTPCLVLAPKAEPAPNKITFDRLMNVVMLVLTVLMFIFDQIPDQEEREFRKALIAVEQQELSILQNIDDDLKNQIEVNTMIYESIQNLINEQHEFFEMAEQLINSAVDNVDSDIKDDDVQREQ